MSKRIDKDSMPCNKPRRTPNDPNKSHVVKACYDGKEKIIHFGEQGASTAGKPKAGDSERMKAKRASFKARHAKNIAKGPSSAAYWANKVKWADGGAVHLKRGGQPEPSILDYLKSVASTVTSLPDAPGALWEKGKDFVRAIPQAARTAAQYMNHTPLTQVRDDAVRAAKAVGRQVKEHPISTAVDLIPVVGDIKAYGEDVRDAARRRALGDLAGAYKIEQLALPMAIAAIAPGVGEGRKALRVADEAADVARAVDKVAETRKLAAKLERPAAEGVRPYTQRVQEGYIADKAEREANLSAFRPYREDNGAAKVFYHATPNEFSVFKPGGLDPEMSGNAIWLSPYAEHQPAAHNVKVRGGGFREGTSVMPLHARMEKPLVLDDPEMISWAREVFADGSSSFPQLMPQKWVDNVRSEGYDSIIYKPKPLKHVDGTEIPSDEYIVFEPTQLKSATGNRGTYDPKNPDIRYAEGGLVEYDPEHIDRIASDVIEGKYAHGGLISRYDDARIDELANQIREGING